VPKVQINRGIVFFADVLGYQDLISNNRIEEAATVINDLLLGIPQQVTDEFLTRFPANADPPLHPIVRQAEWRVVSDSILFTLAFPEKGETWPHWISGLALITAFTGSMMKHGLPIRGAVAFGTYFVTKMSFAGIPFVQAYKTSQDLDWAGVTLLQETQAQLQSDAPKLFDQGFFTRPFHAPFKHAPHGTVHCINWPAFLNRSTNPRPFLFKAFLSHGKSWSPELASKLTNTEAFMTHSQIVTRTIDQITHD